MCGKTLLWAIDQRVWTDSEVSSVHTRLNGELARRFLTPVDLDTIFVSGGSAGGYLTFQAGHLLTPAPRGLIALYGDVFVGDWYAQPHSPEAIVGGVRLGDIEHYSAEIEIYFEAGRRAVTERVFNEGKDPHSMFYHHLIRKGECEFCSSPSS